ncbi:MAG: hypothetical protein N3A58_01325 [Spirochaetes bacterium]|nr:hypothetical protein [Spirochaetota bacterium]
MYISFKNFTYFTNDFYNLTNIIYLFLVYFLSVLTSFFIREKSKFFIYKNLTSDYILSEKRNYSSTYFLSLAGIFLFMFTGVGYSKTYPFNYKKLNLSKRFFIIFIPNILNLIFSLSFYFLSLNGGEFFKIKFINDFLILSVYANFILFLINFLPFPFSDTLLFFTKFDTSIYAFDFLEIFFVLLFVIFRFNLKSFEFYLLILEKIF